MLKRILFPILLGVLISVQLLAQEKKSTFKDTLDGKFDMSDWVINKHGFVPMPEIITEPALGNFGGALSLIFISPQRNAKFPDITGVTGMYTANKSWGTVLFRQGTVPSWGMRYTSWLAYGDINMNFYPILPVKGKHEVELRLTPLAFVLEASKNLYRNDIFAGLRYFFAYTEVSYHPDDPVLPDSIRQIIFDKADFDKNLGLLSIFAEYDSRNSIFTADKGIRLKATYGFNRSFLGSDFDFDRLEGLAYIFFNPYKWWVCGLRAEGQKVTDDAPFYALPYLVMRGMPIMKYQGQETILFETEQRFDLNLRWSLIGFIGTGRSYSDFEYLKDDNWYGSGGVGFRYLVARVLKLRVGIDVAAGPDDQFAWYLCFGHNWNW